MSARSRCKNVRFKARGRVVCALAALLAAPLFLPAASGQPLAAEDAFDAMTREIGNLAKDAKYERALALAKELEAKARNRDGEASTSYARALGWEAFLTQVLGRIQDAGPLFEKSLEIYQKLLPPDHPDVATSINNLAFYYQTVDRLEDSERLYKRALNLREQATAPNALLIADSLNNLAQLYKRQARYIEAAPLLRRSLEIRSAALPPTDPLIAQSLTNIASLLELQGFYAQAEPELRRVLEIRRKSQSPDHPEVAGAISKLAQNLFKQLRFTEADTLFQEALALRFKNQPPDHPDISNSLHDRAQNLIMLGRYSEAEESLTRVIASRRKVLPANNPATAHAIADFAEALLMEGHPDKALEQIRIATGMIVQRGKDDDLGRRMFAAFVRIAWRATQARDKDPRLIPIGLQEEAFLMGQRVEESQAARAIQMMGARLAAKDAKLQALIVERERIEKDAALREQSLSAALAVPLEKRGTRADELRKQIEQLDTRKKDIDRELEEKFPRYFRLIQPDPMKFDDLRALLRPSEAFIQFYTFGEDTFVWGLTKEASAWRRIELTPAEIDVAVGQLRKGLDLEELKRSGNKPRLFDLGASYALHQKLLSPLNELTAGKSELVIVPSGPLTSLPFSTLVLSPPAVGQPGLSELAAYRDADWLTRHVAITILPSAGSIQIVRDANALQSQRRPMIGFGNPVFANPSLASTATANKVASAEPAASPSDAPQVETRGYSSFWRGPAADIDALRTGLSPLPESATELMTVAHNLNAPDQDLMLGPAATEAAVKHTDLEKFRVIYFATHGLVAGEIKGLGEPALALTLPQVASSVDDGLLTASEVAQLKMDADWVILSACNTAAGDQPGAEALSGLAKSFFHAGARALLVSHWRVGSEAAARLTTGTFKKMHDDPSLSRARALQGAMSDMIADASDPWNAYPAFWAPFILVGDSSPTTGTP